VGNPGERNEKFVLLFQRDHRPQSRHLPTTTINRSCGLSEQRASLLPSRVVRRKWAAGFWQVL
jgi:hypothetical protein